MRAGARATHPKKRTRRTIEGSIAYMEMGNGRVCASAGSARLRKGCARKGNKNGMCLLFLGTCKKGANVFAANVSAGIDRMVDTGVAVHLSEVTALPLSASHSLVMPSEV